MKDIIKEIKKYGDKIKKEFQEDLSKIFEEHNCSDVFNSYVKGTFELINQVSDQFDLVTNLIFFKFFI